MNGNALFLCIHARSEHFGRTEHNADSAFFHFLYHTFAHGFAAGGFLNKTHLMGRDTVILHQFTFYLAIYIPFPCFISAEIGKDELCTFMRVESTMRISSDILRA